MASPAENFESENVVGCNLYMIGTSAGGTTSPAGSILEPGAVNFVYGRFVILLFL